MKPFMISTNARSGSTFLANLIGSTKLVGRPKQLAFEDLEGLDDSGIASVLESYYDTLSFDGRMIFMCHSNHLSYFERWLDFVQMKPADLKWVWLVRRDKFAQAISLIRAKRTRIWHITNRRISKSLIEKNDIEVDIADKDIYHLTSYLFFYDQQWESFFDAHGITPYKLHYEDFVDESTWESTVAGILDFLEVPYHFPLNVSTIFRKQGKREQHKTLYGRLINDRLIVQKLGRKKYLPFDYDKGGK